MMRTTTRIVLFVAILSLSRPAFAQPERDALFDRAMHWWYQMRPPVTALVYTPDGSRLYYTVPRPDSLASYVLHLDDGTVEPLFDTARLRSALGLGPGGSGTPFRRFHLVDGDDRMIAFSHENRSFTLDIDTYEVRSVEVPGASAPAPRVLREGLYGRADVVEVPSPDGSELVVLRITRDYRDLQVLAGDPVTGTSRVLLSERYDTCFPEPVWAPPLRRYWPLADGRRFIWRTDVDGWSHLTLRSFDSGSVTQLTSGPFEVDDVIGIDEPRGWVYVAARTDAERPYDIHVHRKGRRRRDRPMGRDVQAVRLRLDEDVSRRGIHLRGPVLEYTPRAIPYHPLYHALAQTGYIVVQLDARGTPGRGRAFLEAGYDRPSIVIADHAAALRQLGERHPYVDLSRVGIVGQSWGGTYTTRALLLAPDLYRAGVAVSGGWWNAPGRDADKATVREACADLRAGEPGPSFDDLEGDLMVIHGTGDANMFGSADLMWWLNDAIEAGKYIDLVMLPDRPHELLRSAPYVWGAVRRHFDRYLRGE